MILNPSTHNCRIHFIVILMNEKLNIRPMIALEGEEG